jgi:hypothetical protein
MPEKRQEWILARNARAGEPVIHTELFKEVSLVEVLFVLIRLVSFAAPTDSYWSSGCNWTGACGRALACGD